MSKAVAQCLRHVAPQVQQQIFQITALQNEVGKFQAHKNYKTTLKDEVMKSPTRKLQNNTSERGWKIPDPKTTKTTLQNEVVKSPTHKKTKLSLSSITLSQKGDCR